jgi:hypothetical protein
MTIRRILLAIAQGVAMITNACSDETQRPTAIAKIQIPPPKYVDFVSSLDKALLKSGLTRFGALCIVVSVITAIGIGMLFFHSNTWFLDLPFALGIPAILLIVTLSFQKTSN